MVELSKFYVDTYDDIIDKKDLRHKITTRGELLVFLELDYMHKLLYGKCHCQMRLIDEEGGK